MGNQGEGRKAGAVFKRALAGVALVAVSLAAAVPSAWAGPELERILSSGFGRFVMTETPAGLGIVKAALGRPLAAGESLEALRLRLAAPEMRTASERLEARLVEMERELDAAGHRALPAEKLTLEQRAQARLLSMQELAELDFVGNGRAADPRRAFSRAAQGEGPVLAPRLRYASGTLPLLHPEQMMQFGFESEYTMNDLEGLVTVYGPAPEHGVSAEHWLAMPVADRVAYVKANVNKLFPDLRAFGGLVKLNHDASLAFMPERLLRDSTGNLEIVLPPCNTFEEWKQRVFLLNEKVGVGSMQGTMSLPRDAFFGHDGPHAAPKYLPADIGFFNFHNDLDTLEKLETGAARFARDPSKPAASSFNHAFLGPMTRLKQGLLVKFLAANARGEMLDAATLKTVSALDNSFKYTGGTAYRPDIVPGRTVLEVRDAHTNVESLLERMSRGVMYLQTNRAEFAAAAPLAAFDSHADFAKLPDSAQSMLRQLFPAKLLPNTDYNEDEKLALEVFRNFAYPMRDWEAPLEFLGRAELGNTVKLAQRGYSAKLVKIAHELEAGQLSAQEAALRVQGAVAQFATESQLGAAYRAKSLELLESAKQSTFAVPGMLQNAG